MRADLPRGLSICELSLSSASFDYEAYNVGYKVVDSEGSEVGFLKAHLTRDWRLRQTNFIIVQRWKRRGLSRALVAELMKHYPDIQSVHGALLGDNEFAYWEASTALPTEALKQTPFYKVFSSFGFTVIEIDPDDRLDVTLKRASKPQP